MTDLLFPDLIDQTETRKPGKPQRPLEPPKPDPLADALIANGLVPNAYHLDINQCLQVKYGMEFPHPWSLPSRLFQFPIEVTDQAKDGTRKIGLLHPLLTDHPYVKHVEATLGIQIDPDGAPNEYGYSKVGIGEWWHAVDLMTSGHWHDLLATAQFTTPEHIARAVAFGLNYSPHEGKKRKGYISTAEAREIMAAIDAPEPADRDDIIRKCFPAPSPVQQDNGSISWPINTCPSDPRLAAWSHILGIEAGYLAHDRGGYLGWVERGRDRFPPEPRVEREVGPYVPPTPDEPVSLADAIGSRRAPKPKAQLDLF